MQMKTVKNLLLLAVLLSILTCGKNENFGGSVKLTIAATTDVHNAYTGYDYFKDEPADSFGLDRIATLLKGLRAQNPNVVYVDNGDSIQGNPLGDMYGRGLDFKGFDFGFLREYAGMGLDAMALGNHEFNYGLDYLNLIIKKAPFPIINANAVDPKTKEPVFTPYVIKEHKFINEEGRPARLKIGYLGLVPPQILVWDASVLRDNIEVLDMRETAAYYAPLMKEAGADLIVALAHTGFSRDPYQQGSENAANYVASVDGIDAVVAGHAHMLFPDPAYADLDGADVEQGLIGGKPVVMGPAYGEGLGAINLTVALEEGGWRVKEASSNYIWVKDPQTKTSADPDRKAYEAIAKTHEAVLDYIRSPIRGASGQEAIALAPITSHFSMVMDSYAVQLVNAAQMEYAQELLKETVYADLPLLSAAAPFKAGGRLGPEGYTNIPAGPLAIKNMADLYVYNNTLALVQVTGAELRDWLEKAAGAFNQINSGSSERQELLNSDFRSYNFDIIDGIEYQIDVSQPSKYAVGSALGHAQAQRIVNLKYQGQPVADDMLFIVATNNYRAFGGGEFPGTGPEKVIMAGPNENRQAIVDYLSRHLEIDPQPDYNWSITGLAAHNQAVFLSSPQGQNNLPPHIQFLGVNEDGFGIYRLGF